MDDIPARCPARDRVIDRIRAEHRLLARVLAAMQAWVVAAREPGARPDTDLFAAMLRYVDEVPNRVHHPQEDEILFPAMGAIPGARRVIEALEREHAASGAMLADLGAAHEGLLRGAPNGLNVLSSAVDEFAEFYWAHMRTEEELLLPLAAAGLTSSQWGAIDAGFAAVNDPLFGSELAQRYRGLHVYITSRMAGPMKGFVEAAVITPPGGSRGIGDGPR